MLALLAIPHIHLGHITLVWVLRSSSQSSSFSHHFLPHPQLPARLRLKRTNQTTLTEKPAWRRRRRRGTIAAQNCEKKKKPHTSLKQSLRKHTCKATQQQHVCPALQIHTQASHALTASQNATDMSALTKNILPWCLRFSSIK